MHLSCLSRQMPRLARQGQSGLQLNFQPTGFALAEFLVRIEGVRYRFADGTGGEPNDRVSWFLDAGTWRPVASNARAQKTTGSAGLHLAMTLAIEPEVLMLDDPATGLDPAARRSLLEAMIYYTRSRERTIFFSTHLLDDVERVADHVAVLDHSVLRSCASVDTFRERVTRWSVGFSQPPGDLPHLPGLLRLTRDAHGLDLIVANAHGQTERILESLGAESIEEQRLWPGRLSKVRRRGKIRLTSSQPAMYSL